jgi:hypothetical protein
VELIGPKCGEIEREIGITEFDFHNLHYDSNENSVALPWLCLYGTRQEKADQGKGVKMVKK